MNIRAQRFATKTRTWLLIAGLTALLIGIGALSGGVWLYVFVFLALAMNVGGYWFSDRLALEFSGAKRVAPGTRPDLEAIEQDLARRALLLDPALVQEHHAIGNLTGEADLVGDDDHGAAFPGQRPHHPQDLADQLGIER